GGRGLRGRRRRRIWGKARPGETGDRPHQPLAVPQRHADLLEVGLGQVGQNVRVDLMLAEQRFVLSEADAVQPLGDVHLRTACAETRISSPRWRMESRTWMEGVLRAPWTLIVGRGAKEPSSGRGGVSPPNGCARRAPSCGSPIV